LSYPLYRLQNVETWEQSKVQVAIAETQLQSAQQDLMVRVAQAYFDVLTAQDSLETIGAQKRAISEQLPRPSATSRSVPQPLLTSRRRRPVTIWRWRKRWSPRTTAIPSARPWHC